MAKIAVEIDLVSITCSLGECGIVFGVPVEWQQAKRRTRNTFWCPNGHAQHYTARAGPRGGASILPMGSTRRGRGEADAASA